MTPSPQSPTPWFLRPFFLWSAGILGAISAGVIVFEALDISIFAKIGMPHEYCYLRSPKLIWLHVISDVLIGAAYVSISASLGYLVYRASKGIPFNWVFLAFGLFIVSCGLTHFMEVWVIWEPVYWLSGYVKVVTAAASLATAIALFPLLPKVFRLIEAARQGEERRVQIEQLNQELERFNFSVAHDLRAPLRGISGFSRELVEDYAQDLPEKARERLGRIEAAAQRMDLLITDLLRYSTITRQQVALAPVDIAQVVRDTTSLLEATIEQTKATISVLNALPVVQGDRALLQVVFQNLLANSLKFVAPGVAPRVEITSVIHGSQVSVFIRDNGIGIPEEFRSKVFAMFERGHTGYAGTGIGLAMVARAVERMQGRIEIDDNPVQHGTRFRLQLPHAPEPRA